EGEHVDRQIVAGLVARRPCRQQRQHRREEQDPSAHRRQKLTWAAMRIVSLLASGTELVCALGAGDELVGRSHECDDPPWVTRLPVLSRPTFDVSGTSAAIDRLVRAKLRAGEPLYALDQAALEALAPDVVISQSHCHV